MSFKLRSVYYLEKESAIRDPIKKVKRKARIFLMAVNSGSRFIIFIARVDKKVTLHTPLRIPTLLELYSNSNLCI